MSATNERGLPCLPADLAMQYECRAVACQRQNCISFCLLYLASCLLLLLLPLLRRPSPAACAIVIVFVIDPLSRAVSSSARYPEITSPVRFLVDLQRMMLLIAQHVNVETTRACSW